MEVNEQAFANGYSTGFVAGKRVERINSAEIIDSCIKKPGSMKAVVSVGGDIPTRAHSTDAGLDVYAMEGGWILPKSHKAFDTGFHVAIPSGFVGFLTAKSGLMLKGITSRGTIDSGYTGSIKAVLFNHSWRPVKIRKGQKISQLVIVPIVTPGLEFVESLDKTDRADGGFGSTGL